MRAIMYFVKPVEAYCRRALMRVYGPCNRREGKPMKTVLDTLVMGALLLLIVMSIWSVVAPHGPIPIARCMTLGEDNI